MLEVLNLPNLRNCQIDIAIISGPFSSTPLLV